MSVIGVSILVAYITLHNNRWDKYWTEVEKGARSAFQVVRIGLDKDGARFVLLAAGKPVANESELPPLPFGLERVGSVKGTLAIYQARVDRANEILENKANQLLNGFHASGPYFSIESSRLGYSNRFEMRIPSSEFPEIRRLRGTALQNAFRDLLWRESIYGEAPEKAEEFRKDISLPQTALSSSAPVQFAQLNRPQTASDLTPVAQPRKKAVRQGKAKKAAAEPRPSLHRELEALVETSLQAARTKITQTDTPKQPRLRLANEAEREYIETSFTRWNSEALSALDLSKTTTLDLNARLAKVNKDMADSLVRNLSDETRPLWLFGHYRWLEMLFWVWFGTLTHAIVTTGLFVVQVRTEEYWHPGELLRTLSRFIYAPVLVVALFFLGNLLGANVAVLEFGRNTWATLGIAFTLGMFPTSVYRLLRQFLTTIFREDLTNVKNSRPAPAIAKAVVQRPAAAKAPYTIDALKNNVTAIVVAPIK